MPSEAIKIHEGALKCGEAAFSKGISFPLSDPEFEKIWDTTADLDKTQISLSWYMGWTNALTLTKKTNVTSH